MKTRVPAGLLCVGSLLLVTSDARAQRAVPPRGHDPAVAAGLVIAGPDVGFRVDRYEGATPVGELVVRRDGQWVAVEFAAKARPAR